MIFIQDRFKYSPKNVQERDNAVEFPLQQNLETEDACVIGHEDETADKNEDDHTPEESHKDHAYAGDDATVKYLKN